MFSAEAENLISRLSGGLAPADRNAFRDAAEAALAAEPQCCWGEGSTYRVIAKVWRDFFRPPTMEDRPTAWTSNRKKFSKLITEPPRKDCRVRRRSHSMK